MRLQLRLLQQLPRGNDPYPARSHGVIVRTALSRRGYKSLHPGGVNFVAGDGSVHLISATIDYKLYNELGTRAGNEPASFHRFRPPCNTRFV